MQKLCEKCVGNRINFKTFALPSMHPPAAVQVFVDLLTRPIPDERLHLIRTPPLFPHT